MSADTPTDIALSYVRTELAELKGSMREDFRALRDELTAIAAEMREHSALTGPRLSVLEHRLTAVENEQAQQKQQHDKDVAELRQERKDSRATWVAWIGLAIAAVSAAAALIALLQ